MSVECCDQLCWETPPCHQPCSIWSCHGYCQAVPRTVGQDSKVLLLPVSTPAKSGGDFTSKAVRDTLFCFVKKKIISTVTGMWMRCCSRQRGPYGHGCASGSSAEICQSSFSTSGCENARRLALFIREKAVHSNNKDEAFEYFLEFIS